MTINNDDRGEGWRFGTTNYGLTYHAMMRSYINPENTSSGLHTVKALCGSVGMRRIVTKHKFIPTEVNKNFGSAAEACKTCVRRWSARHAPEIEGFNRECVSCKQEKNINQFHVDKRTKDGISKTCLDCVEAQKRVVSSMQRELEIASSRNQRREEHKQRIKDRLELLLWRQESMLMMPVCCSEGHALTPTIDAEIGDSLSELIWVCDCGDSPVHYDSVNAAELMKRAVSVESAIGLPTISST